MLTKTILGGQKCLKFVSHLYLILILIRMCYVWKGANDLPTVF